MKKIIPSIITFCCIVIFLNSCAVGKNAVEVPNPHAAVQDDAAAQCFVQMNDGTIKQYASLKLVTGVLKTPHLLADNKVIINAKEIIAYQNNRHYAVSAKMVTSTKKTCVAVETLPGFAVKVISGKLNVYSRKYYNGANTACEYFIQSGQDGYIVAYSKDVLKSMLKDDVKALDYFNSKSKPSSKSKKFLMAVELYNNNQLMTKN